MFLTQRGHGTGTSAGSGLMRSTKAALLAVSLVARAAAGATPAAQSLIGELPATFAGVLPYANCKGIRYQIDLMPNARFAMSTQRLGDGHGQGVALSSGMWWISRETHRLMLDSGPDGAGENVREAWQVKDARTLRKLDAQGDSIASALNYELARADSLTLISPDPQPAFVATLANTRWVPLRIGGHAVKLSAQEHEPWIVLDQKTRRVTGSGGCNAFTGIYDVGVYTLRIRSLAATLTSCPDLGSEPAFLKALNETWGYCVVGRRLKLLDEQDVVLVELEERNR